MGFFSSFVVSFCPSLLSYLVGSFYTFYAFACLSLARHTCLQVFPDLSEICLSLRMLCILSPPVYLEEYVVSVLLMSVCSCIATYMQTLYTCRSL